MQRTGSYYHAACIMKSSQKTEEERWVPVMLREDAKGYNRTEAERRYRGKQ